MRKRLAKHSCDRAFWLGQNVLDSCWQGMAAIPNAQKKRVGLIMKFSSLLKSLVVPIPSEKQKGRGWSVAINSVELPRERENMLPVTFELAASLLVNGLQLIQLEHSSFGVLSYGLTEAGYDGWSFHELGGGGSVIVPYALIKDAAHQNRIWIGVVRQKRHNQGGDVCNVPRGFLDPKERHFAAAKREAEEELGYVGALKLLPGDPANPNSAFFETAEPGEGVKFYGMEIDPRALRPDGDGYVFNPDVVKADEGSKAKRAAEQILGSRFIPLREALRISDMFTVAGAGRLLGSLLAGQASVSS